MRNLMLCILLLSAYASAEVRFYGSLGSGIESGRFRWNGQSTTQTAVRDLDSYVGIQGRHPIGGQNAPGWQWAHHLFPPTTQQTNNNHGNRQILQIRRTNPYSHLFHRKFSDGLKMK